MVQEVDVALPPSASFGLRLAQTTDHCSRSWMDRVWTASGAIG